MVLVPMLRVGTPAGDALREGFAIPALGGVEVPPLLGDRAQIVVGDGGIVLVAQPFLDLQGFAIPALGGVEVPPLLGDRAQLVHRGYKGWGDRWQASSR
jgi:hypothetical protein